jgi:hypothetical protein
MLVALVSRWLIRRKDIQHYSIGYTSSATVGGRTSARRNPTGTILGNQAIEQEGERICKTKVIIKGRTKVCTHKLRNRNGTIRLVTIVYNY